MVSHVQSPCTRQQCLAHGRQCAKPTTVGFQACWRPRPLAPPCRHALPYFTNHNMLSLPRCAQLGSFVTRASDDKNPTVVSDQGLPRDAVVGVLGGGQLGRMMALAASNFGVRFKCLDPTPDAPAAVAAQQVVGSFRDPAAIREFSQDVDVLTVEIEHVDVAALEQVAQELNLDVEPTPRTVRIIQDKFAQKQHFVANGVPVADFKELPDAAAAAQALQEFGTPLMLKSKRLAYDGRGNFVVQTSDDLQRGVDTLGGYQQGLYAERWAPFVKELAVMVVRSRSGHVDSYPVVETIHRDNICHVTEAPADVPDSVLQKAKQVAEAAISCLDGAGIFGVEMFLLANGDVLLNEVAPRPHNSGHYTQDGCVTSQFENHVRAVLGWPLGDTSLNCGSAIMLNILGEADDDEGVKIAHGYMERAYKVPGAKVHWYGKEGMRVGRKVGHINIVAADRKQARAKLAAIDPSAAKSLEKTTEGLAAVMSGSGDKPRPQVGIIMGSDSDLATMKAAAEILEQFEIPYELTIVSAHRTPDRMMTYAQTAHKRGLKAIIAGAGGAAHLPGMVAAMTPLPVVGVPVKPTGSHLDGVDALLSIVQMPRGVPVATVAIGNAANAGLLAARIIAAQDEEQLGRMLRYQADMKEVVLQKAAKVEEVGWKLYGK